VVGARADGATERAIEDTALAVEGGVDDELGEERPEGFEE
jgi:hypothetical protein